MIDNRTCRFRLVLLHLLLIGTIALTPLPAFSAATIILVNGDGVGEGFNDPTPAAPVGGNAGTTLGQQRLNAFQYAANLWGAQITSGPQIKILANFDPLACTATSGVLGAAGPLWVWHDWTGAPKINTWYPVALANKLYGADLTPGTTPDDSEIQATFNSNLGQTDCLTDVSFYLGLDGNHGNNIDLVAVLLHEFAHGLGFLTWTDSDGTTGEYFDGRPFVYDYFLSDTTTNKVWTGMTDSERAASAINPRGVVWTGPNVTTEVPFVLDPGTPELLITSPDSVAGIYMVGSASFGPALSSPGVTGKLVPVVDQRDGTGLACDPLKGKNVKAVNGNIALIDRGVCTYVTKVKNAQNAGAIGVVIADNAAGSPPYSLPGTDPTITIPSVRITQADGVKLKDVPKSKSKNEIATLRINLSQFSGADASGRMILHTPNPYEGGSSVSHWDTIAFPNQLMEPFLNPDETHSVSPPYDLTLPLLKDIGW